MRIRRFATVAALTAVTAVGAIGLLGPRPIAWAKGPTAATVEGPGLAEPIQFELGMHGEAAPEYADFIAATQAFSLGTRELCRLAQPPVQAGPRYRLTWRLPSLSEYLGADREALRGPIVQDFYPDASGGAVTRVVGTDSWVRGTAGARSWWRRLVDDMGGPAGGSDRVGVRGPDLAGSVAIDHRYAINSSAVRFFSESGMAQSVLYGGVSPCREPVPPAGALGPPYTVTWTMGTDEWGVQDVYPFAAGGPVVHDREAGFAPGTPGGWFRADSSLLTVWAALGLPTEAPAAPESAPAAPGSAPVAAARATGGANGPAANAWWWLLAIGGAALLATGGALGIRWRRHGQLLPYRHGSPGAAG